MRDDPAVVALVTRARAGDRDAWNAIIERYAPLVWSICQRYRLNREERDDVSQNVWLLLIEKIGTIRVPAALPGWLARTTQRECLRVVRAAHRYEHLELLAEAHVQSGWAATMIEEEILAAERGAALRAAFAELGESCRELLSMLIGDPPLSYAEISAKLHIAMGSIGPKRARCLKALRRSPHLIALTDPATAQDPQPRMRKVAVVTDRWSDEKLLQELRQAFHTREAIDPEFIEMGQAAFEWRTMDTELAQLTYDSTGDLGQVRALRAEAASIRALTFASAHLTIELEVSGDTLIGQVIPIQPASVAIQVPGGPEVEVALDEVGCFSVQPLPAGRFRLRCRAGGGLDVLTGWVTL